MRNEAMQYFGFFGTTYNFYTNSKSKLYTILGCILSIISIILCLLVFFLLYQMIFLEKLKLLQHHRFIS